MFSVPGWNVPTTGPAAQAPTAAELAKKAKVAEKLKAHKAKLKHLKNASEGNHIPLGKVRKVGGGGGGDGGDDDDEKVEGGGAVKAKEKEKKVKKGPKVTEENLQKLYEKVIEGKTEKRKRGAAEGGSGEGEEKKVKDGAEGDEGEKKKKKRKRGKKNGGDKSEQNGSDTVTEKPQPSAATSSTTPSTSTAAPPTSTSTSSSSQPTTKSSKSTPQPPPTTTTTAPPDPSSSTLSTLPALTPLQQKMRAKLTSARFRHLNEALYTTPSPTSFTLFQSQPSMFLDYHLGFRQQVQSWPENPVDIFTRQILHRATLRPLAKNNPQKPTHMVTKPLPRPPPTYTCTIADLGCGDAKLAENVLRECGKNKALNLKVLSFDLSNKSNPQLVTEADIANLPLEKESVDVVIFCLALMGTNYLDFVDEAVRVLRIGGECWVAEIKSRFTIPSNSDLPPPPGGKKHHKKPIKTDLPSNNGKIGVLKRTPHEPLEGDMDDPTLFDPSAAAPGDSSTTELPTLQAHQIPAIYHPFIAALARRGLVLKPGTGSVDDSNKMFVRMEFFKPRPKEVREAPTGEEEGGDYDLRNVTRGGRGGLRGGRGGAARGGGRGGYPGEIRRGKWLADVPEHEETVRKREEGILKPCVYKLR